MRKILIFGNSGSGKSTLAKQLCEEDNLAHLDLDSLAWQATLPPERKPMLESKKEINQFIQTHQSWVIEGCYADLLTLATVSANEVIFLNLPIESCIENAKKRPWEPHKYETKAAQDANLNMLIDWIANYQTRTDTFSQQAHQALFDAFQGTKVCYTSNFHTP